MSTRYSITHVKRNPITVPKNFDMVPIELKDIVPQQESFSVKRIYYISNAKDTYETSQHSHLVEKEIFVVMAGQCTLIIDDGSGIKKITIKTDDAIWVPSLVWHGFENLSSDLILLALSSTNYGKNRSDYIGDHQEFKIKVKSTSN
jgi:mannose-6-phosphate isomerase-like protein (cupin superfamily)